MWVLYLIIQIKKDKFSKYGRELARNRKSNLFLDGNLNFNFLTPFNLQASMYEQLFAKPKMTEKLLGKPPFRYLHDIFTATMGKTGWGQGLFQGDELNSKSFEDKDSKLGFLVKIITLTEMMLDDKMDIKQSLVLAGQSADKTNLWLQ